MVYKNGFLWICRAPPLGAIVAHRLRQRRGCSRWMLAAAATLLVAAPALATHDCNDSANIVANCGFESGDFLSWASQDIMSPLFALAVGGSGLSPGYGVFTSAPTEGSFAALHGFEGMGPGTIELSQDVTLGAEAVLRFDYRAGWDLLNFATATLDRTFDVVIEPGGGGATLQSDRILTAAAGSVNLDTGNLQGMVDLSGFAGTPVRIRFVWTVPEFFSGPAFFQLDNVLVRPTLVLMDPAVVAGASTALQNAGGTLRLLEPEVNGLIAFVPEPGFPLQLGPGVLLLALLHRRRERRERHRGERVDT